MLRAKQLPLLSPLPYSTPCPSLLPSPPLLALAYVSEIVQPQCALFIFVNLSTSVKKTTRLLTFIAYTTRKYPGNQCRNWMRVYVRNKRPCKEIPNINNLATFTDIKNVSWCTMRIVSRNSTQITLLASLLRPLWQLCLAGYAPQREREKNWKK